jgi:hypothetical protein
MKRHEGPDFDVFYFSDLSTKSSKAGIAGVQRQPGRVGDISVEWSRWSEGGNYRSETVVHDFYGQSAPRGYAGLILHLFTVAVTEQDVARMEGAAATLRLERAR